MVSYNMQELLSLRENLGSSQVLVESVFPIVLVFCVVFFFLLLFLSSYYEVRTVSCVPNVASVS